VISFLTCGDAAETRTVDDLPARIERLKLAGQGPSPVADGCRSRFFACDGITFCWLAHRIVTTSIAHSNDKFQLKIRDVVDFYGPGRPSPSCTMPENKEKFEADTSPNAEQIGHAPSKPKRWRPSRALRSILMVFVGFVGFVIVSGIVLYKPIMYGDMIENFGIVMMLTVPVIVAVAFRVGLDSWLDAE
jgi:hypothetical protein